MTTLDLKDQILKKIFPETLFTPDEIQKSYPPRFLPAEAMVTRFAPSPTGFLHIGGVYTALISERFAHQTGGVFYLRIEDTDKKREIPGTAALITSSLVRYGIKIDEGETQSGLEIGSYGPYKQSARVAIYKVYIKFLIERGLAYPCFCTHEVL